RVPLNADKSSLLRAVQDLTPQIRAASEAIERGRRLPTALLRSLTGAGLFRMWVPRALGGFEVDLLTNFDVIEQLSMVDSSVGWGVMIGTGTSCYLSAFLPDVTAREIFRGDEHVVVGGFVNPSGVAIPTEGGFTVTGRWPFTSGCQDCQWLAGGVKRVDPTGR